MVETLGNVGYQIGAVGIAAFTLAFLVIVRWWTDLLGRLIAGVLFTLTLVLIMSTLRMLHVELPGGLLTWRLGVFWLFGAVVWSALGTFIWAQFWAPRIRESARMTTRREYRSEEQADLADRRHGRDGRSDRVPGGDR